MGNAQARQRALASQGGSGTTLPNVLAVAAPEGRPMTPGGPAPVAWSDAIEYATDYAEKVAELLGHEPLDTTRVKTQSGTETTLADLFELEGRILQDAFPIRVQRASRAFSSEGGDDCIPVVFTWTAGGNNVYLAASFNGWRDQIPMVRSGQEFSVVQEIPRGVHQYKFIVDSQWRYAQDQPKTQDSQGNMNNVVDITEYQRFQVGMMVEKPEPAMKFGQTIPDPNDYTLDAPVIPQVLSKSAYSALPTRPQSGVQPLSIPNHCICDHVYLRERGTDSASTVAVTHRYGQKYSTTVFAMRGSHGVAAAHLESCSIAHCHRPKDSALSGSSPSTGSNPLRAAVRSSR